MIRYGSKFLHFLTRQGRFRAGSILTFQNRMITMKLMWALQNIPKLQEKVKVNKAMYGTVDTWLMYKLTKGNVFVTDIGNASASGN